MTLALKFGPNVAVEHGAKVTVIEFMGVGPVELCLATKLGERQVGAGVGDFPLLQQRRRR